MAWEIWLKDDILKLLKGAKKQYLLKGIYDMSRITINNLKRRYVHHFNFEISL